MSAIPLLSLSTSSPAQFLEVLSSTGFLHLSLADTPVKPSDVAGAFAISSYLYDALPLSERLKYPRDKDPDFNGLAPLGTTALNAEGGQKRADWKEVFGYGRYSPPKTRSDQELPEGVDREALEGFHAKCYELMLMLLDKLSLAFDLPPGFFRERHAQRGQSGLTLLNYPIPPSDAGLEDDDIRAGAHKDWGSVTLLFQEPDGQPGLEIFLPESRPNSNSVEEGKVKLMSEVDLDAGTWHAAPIVPDTVLVNLGLMMEAWTGGTCVATLHRVVFPPAPTQKKPRRSIAYFGTPDPEVSLTPVQRRSAEGEAAATAPTVKQFFEERLKLATTRSQY
ncbi:Clavaminate synthase-like protein [Punctularia strigosozonata HHB-11173 SS5]|uniref:Clavaminate synthase-like protein n=1 Tax=Punctularia strigosozonata (strain HHB-11173) TaxID=741275 RepID=UPI000441744D|nr:Clavaminate synthase-like protein [Punctularia strigosozonata HHB-11173 SS5]EIN07875.1 Clavaminate synthase-like protein [Punctularia strigosozonata HHB-11173 SS5]